MFEQYKHIIPDIYLGSGVIDTLAQWFCRDDNRKKYRNVLVVCDGNTRRVAAQRVCDILKTVEGLNITEFCFEQDEPLPDEYSIGCVMAAYTPEIDIILAAGSGTIKDICTFAGARVKCPVAVAGTAPSMDGYASLGSAMLLGGVKVTPMTQCPVAIFCDSDILSEAPMHMIAAGIGDMLGKITSLADWKLSHLLTGEPMPADIFDIMQEALDKVIKAVPSAAVRDKQAIEDITEGLILSGIAMSLYGDSRPASGTEHHLAHFWEMRMLACGQTPALHGTKVAVAAVTGLILWQELKNAIEAYLDNETAGDIAAAAGTARSTDNAQRISEIKRLYGAAAQTMLQTENPNLPFEHIKAHLSDILKIAESLPDPQVVIGLMSQVHMNACPKEIALSAGLLIDGIIYARERKKTYTLLQLLGDLGLLEKYAGSARRYFQASALSSTRCFVLDMDGTIYLGNKLFPYTLSFLEHLRAKGMDYVFFTNNSSQNAAHYLNKLRAMGIDIPDNKLLMSTHVLLDYLKGKQTGKHVYIAGTKALMDDFEAAGYTLAGKSVKPDFCVLGFDTDMDYDRLTELCDFIRGGVPVYGVNMDCNCPVEGGFIPDCGSLAAAVHASTGAEIEFFGKPSRRALDYISRKTGYAIGGLCFIGDRLYTDIAITNGSEACSVLVLSGETKREDLPASAYIPDIIAGDLQEFQEQVLSWL